MMLTLPELVYNFQEKQEKCFKLRAEKIFLLLTRIGILSGDHK